MELFHFRYILTSYAKVLYDYKLLLLSYTWLESFMSLPETDPGPLHCLGWSSL